MPADESEILARVRAGELDAIQVLFEEYRTRIFRICLAYTDNAEDARDVVQETFLRAYRSIGRFRGDSAVSTWLTRIAINICFNLRRGRRITESLDPDRLEALPVEAPVGGPSSPEDAVRVRELKERVMEIVATMPPRERMAFILKHFEQLKIREISERMEISEGTVKSFLHRAIVTLRDELAGYLPGSRSRIGKGEQETR